MTPTQRKKQSEAALHALGIPINSTLPLIESEKETTLRTEDELFRRLVALWAVAGAAHLPTIDFFQMYVVENRLSDWLSTRERRYLLGDDRSDKERIHFTWQSESLYFLGWSGGLVSEIAIPKHESSVVSFMHLFPQEGENLEKLRSAIILRSVGEMLDWADLLYRVHWGVRQEQVAGASASNAVVPGAILEWHRAANWMTRYDDENDWDQVGTDT